MAKGAVNTILNELEKYPIEEGCTRFFRGHHELSYKMEPALYRNDALRQKESYLYHEALMRLPNLLEHSNGVFDIMVKLQHYGLPTRLLDLTTNPLIALFFASNNKKPKTGNAVLHFIDVPNDSIVYYDNPVLEMMVNMANNPFLIVDDNEKKFANQVLEKLGYDSKVKLDSVVLCVKPLLNNPRIIRQSGAFLLFGEKGIFEDISIFRKNKIEIANNSLGRILEQLKILGITQSSVFPETEKILEDVKNKYI